MTSTPPVYGIQSPRIELIPNARWTLGDDAIELAASAGLHLDPWQCHIMRGSMGETRRDEWAAFEVGLIVSRQNGKGSILEARELHALFLEPQTKLILHSAHEFKDLWIETPILTVDGWKTLGEVSDQDEVYGPDGQPTKVVAAHPILRNSDCYRVTMADGQSFVAGAGHLWAVTKNDRGKTSQCVVTTQEMFEVGTVTEQARSGRTRRTYNWRVDLPAPFEGPRCHLPVDPYLLGYWLGDGSSHSGRIYVGAEDLEYARGVLRPVGSVRDPRTGVWTLRIPGLTTRLVELGLVGDKRIPTAYLTASIEQRRALLAGIMDSDGTVSAHQLAVTMVKPELMEDVLQLVRGLGYRATLREFRASLNGQDAGPMYRVQFSPQAGNPFRLPRKREAVVVPKRATRSTYNAVVSIERVPTVPTRCITVAHESGCYQVGSFTITHNTAAEGFLRAKSLIDNTDALRKRVKSIRTSHGEEGIELLDGSRLRFVARSTGSGRGFSGDLVILDEAYALSAAAMAALMPTLSARPNPQIWYTSSAGMPASDQLRRVRDRGRAQAPGRLAYFEFSAHEESSLDDRQAWLQANPAVGYRIKMDFIETERAALPDSEFMRERLGIWPDDGSGAIISDKVWLSLADPKSRPGSKLVFAVDAAPDRGSAAIASAGMRDDGRIHTKVVDHRPGIGWVVPRLVDLWRRYSPAAILIDPAGPIGSIIAELREYGIEPVLLTARDMAQACGVFHDDAVNDRLRHTGQENLAIALRCASTRPLGDAWVWHRRESTDDICPLVASTMAVHGFRAYGIVAEPWVVRR